MIDGEATNGNSGRKGSQTFRFDVVVFSILWEGYIIAMIIKVVTEEIQGKRLQMVGGYTT